MATIFLSFANDDQAFATELRRSLNELGHEVSSFDAELTPGERIGDLVDEEAPITRYKHYEYGQSKLIPVHFDRQVPPGTFEYTLSYLIEHECALSWFDER